MPMPRSPPPASPSGRTDGAVRIIGVSDFAKVALPEPRPMYAIRFRHDLNLLDIRWTGQFTPDAVDAYARELVARFVREGFRPGYRLRMDMTDSAVQPVAAATLINRRLGDFPRADRIAIVTRSAIARLQVRRFMTQSYLRIFDDAALALDWLTEADVQAA